MLPLSHTTQNKRKRLTCALNGRNQQIAREDLAHPRLGALLPRERALEEAHERVPEGRRDEEAVERHLGGLDVDFRVSERVEGARGVFGRALRGRLGDV